MVLVVEDEAALGAAVAESLADAGFVVDRAGDGEEALRACPRTRLRPDHLRPEDAARRRDARSIGSSRRDAPDMARRILFVTGDVAGTEAERFLEETGCRWLAKPFRLRDLLRTAHARSWPRSDSAERGRRRRPRAPPDRPRDVPGASLRRGLSRVL